jgi:S1-C subfamily serine protease
MKRHVPLRGVYVAQPGFVFGQAVPADVIISAINGVPCHDIDTFTNQLQEISDKEYFSVAWLDCESGKRRHRHEDHVKMQRQWSLFKVWDLHLHSRQWLPRVPIASKCHVSADTDESSTASPSGEALTYDDSSVSDENGMDRSSLLSPTPQQEEALPDATVDIVLPPTKRAKTSKVGAMAALDQSICSISFSVVRKLDLDIFPGAGNDDHDIVCLHGVGVIIDAERGFILTDRGTVPQRLADIEVTLGDDTRSATVFHMHPDHSIVVLKLDDDVEFSQGHFGKASNFEQREFNSGDRIDFVGVDSSGRRFATEVTVQTQRLGKFPRHWPPRWCEKNLEAVVLVEDPENTTSGVLCDASGNIHALYAVVGGQDGERQWKCGYGIPTSILKPMLDHLAQPEGVKAPPVVPSLGLDFRHVALQKLSRLPPHLRPSEEWLEKLRAHGGKVLQVTNAAKSSPCNGAVKVGDFLVAVQGEGVARASDVEVALRKVVGTYVGQAEPTLKINIVVLRCGRPHEIEVSVPPLSSDGSTRVLVWHGLLLHDTPRIVCDFQNDLTAPTGVHIAQTFLGSPADTHEIPGDFIVSVNGEPTPTLDAIIALSAASPPHATSLGDMASASSLERRHLRIESADVAGCRFVLVLEPDPLYWPTVELSQDQHGQWRSFERRSGSQTVL